MTPTTSDDSMGANSLPKHTNQETNSSSNSILVGGEIRGRSFTGTTIIVSTFNIRYAGGAGLISGSLLRRLGLDRYANRPGLIDTNLKSAAHMFTSGTIMPPADIVAVQEADLHTKRAARRDIAGSLATGLSMVYAQALAEASTEADPQHKEWYLDFEETIAPNDGGNTGIAMLSRFPFVKIYRIDLPSDGCPWRPRLAMASSFAFGTSELLFINAHIDPHAAVPGQVEQHLAVLRFAANYNCPIVYAGDFNTLSKAACNAILDLLRHEGFVTVLPIGLATWRSGAIRLHTDWIFVRNAAIKRWGVAKPLRVSDHWPVWAEVDLAKVEECKGA